MKKLFTLLAAVLLTATVWAQTPQSFKYQAVARDAGGDVVADQAVGMQISILQSSTSGTAVYVETFIPTTNEFGLINLNIGAGTVVSGDLSTIDWSADTYFLKVEMDITGGTTYEEYGTSQLLSVPYALHAKTAANTFSGNYNDLTGSPNNVSSFTNDAGYLTSITETDPVFGTSVASGITGTDTTNWNNKLEAEVDGSVTNEIQTISRAGTIVTLSNGGGTFTDSVNTQSLSAVLAVNNDGGASQIKNLADPTNAQDAVTKAYVDSLIDKILELETLTTTFKDYDGNLYSSVKIGNQVWMAENLKTTHYANGDPIPDGTGEDNISGEPDPEYWFAYNDDLNNVYTYGRLYTWYTVTNSGNICPDGWHVPSDTEWTQLTDYLGGASVAGGKLKETGTTHWNSPNTGATNESCFTGLPGGYRYFNGAFNYIGIYGYWWSSTVYNASSAWKQNMDYDNASTYRGFNNKKFGLSVRCVRD
jgi:uncharacterized protein (TIGR02145 family)